MSDSTPIQSHVDNRSLWITVDEAAAYLQCGKRVVYAAIAKNQLRAARIAGGRMLRTKLAWCDAYCESRAPQEVTR